MSLRDYELPTEKVPIDEKNHFVVRGISFEDVTRLVLKHGPVLALCYSKFVTLRDGEGGLDPESLAQLVGSVMRDFPEAVAELIGIAADEVDQAPKIRKLPVGVQFDAIEKIIRLTFTGEADVKKLVEIVTRMAEGLKETAEGLTAPNVPIPSGNGNGAFVSR